MAPTEETQLASNRRSAIGGAFPLVALAGLFLGTSVVASRLAIGEMTPVSFTAVRLLLAAVAYCVLFTARGWPKHRRLWLHAAVLGVLEAVAQLAIISALRYVSSGIAALVTSLQPALIVVLAHVFLPDEKLSVRTSIGVLLAMLGAGLLAVQGETGLANAQEGGALGYGLLLFAVPLIAGMTIYARVFLRQYDALHVSGIEIMVAAVVVNVLGGLTASIDLGGVTAQGYAAVAYSAFASPVLGVLLLYTIIRRHGATDSALIYYIAPVVAGLAGVLLLGEVITETMLVGSALILAGIGVLLAYGGRRAGTDAL